jgi:5-hydroxyisourate hydrolase
MSGITTHVLDTTRGCPAAGVRVRLETCDPHGAWREVATGATDAEGRLRSLLAEPPLPGEYRLTFETGAYFAGHGTSAFYPCVVITFNTTGDPHYHVPLLLSPYGYSTYRGS